MVIHGGIDGFSRFVVFLNCSTNNTSDTVIQLFKAAVREYGLPLQVRSDHGGENVKVCNYDVMLNYIKSHLFFVLLFGLQVAHYMIQNSVHENPMLTGSSTHNQRIERLWRDVYRCVVGVYHQLFYFLEESGRLNPLSEIDLYCLHLVYLPKINEALATFVDGWNRHSLSSEHNLTPLQLFETGLIMNGNPNNSVLVDSDTQQDESTHDPPSVEVPPTVFSINTEQITHLNLLLQNEAYIYTNFNINMYDIVRQFAHHCDVSH